MAKINIHIEADSNVDKELISRLTQALAGQQITLGSSLPKVETPAEDPKVDDTKKAKKAKTPDIKVGDTVDMGESKQGTAEEKSDTPEITIEDVRKVLADAKRSGKASADLKGVLSKFGANGVSELAVKHYAAVIEAVKAL